MTVSERLFEFKSIGRLTMSKAAWYARMRHVRDYYSGQQCAEAGIQRLWEAYRHWIAALLRPSLGYALRASLRLFKFDPVEFVAGMTE